MCYIPLSVFLSPVWEVLAASVVWCCAMNQIPLFFFLFSFFRNWVYVLLASVFFFFFFFSGLASKLTVQCSVLLSCKLRTIFETLECAANSRGPILMQRWTV